MPAGGSYTLETDWVFGDVKVYALYAQVDTDNHVPGEENENNNVLGPVHVVVRAPDVVVQQTHQDFQLGLASGLDLSHPEGILRRGIYLVPQTEPEVYQPDVQVDKPPLPPSHVNNVNQIKPTLASDGTGIIKGVTCTDCDYKFVKITPDTVVYVNGIKRDLLLARERAGKQAFIEFNKDTAEVATINWAE